ncbi:hypothetical protein QQP08_014523 [Theobroma cacao]|nr:hypothetical protein QQP08_014523 [Theobroma cacao]
MEVYNISQFNKILHTSIESMVYDASPNLLINHNIHEIDNIRKGGCAIFAFENSQWNRKESSSLN